MKDFFIVMFLVALLCTACVKDCAAAEDVDEIAGGTF